MSSENQQRKKYKTEMYRKMRNGNKGVKIIYFKFIYLIIITN